MTQANTDAYAGGRSSAVHDWIDAHVHVWSDDLVRYPLAPGYRREQMQPPRFTPQDLLTHCEPCGVRRIHLIQMIFYGYDNSYLLDVIASDPARFRGTAVVDPAAADLADTMRRLAARGIRAFRVYPALTGADPADWLAHEGYQTLFSVGAETNQAVSCLIDPVALPALDRMCTRYPQTPVIIDHLCRIGASGQIREPDVDALCRMSRHPRVMVKIGAFYALGSGRPPHHDLLPLIRRVIEAFGPQRCMWESDCPFQIVQHTYADALAVITDACSFLSDADREQILQKTAESFLFDGDLHV